MRHGLPDSITGAPHLFLDGGASIRVRAVEVRNDLLALVSDHDHCIGDPGLIHCTQHMPYERLPGNLVENLRLVGLHAGAETGSQNYRYGMIHSTKSSAAVGPLAALRRMDPMHAAPSRPLTIAAALGVGVMVALQSRINAELSERVGAGVLGAAISFGTGLLLVAAIVASRREYRRSFATIPGLVRNGGLRWWHLVGGLGGAWLVTTQGIVVGVVGVTTFTVGVVAGQVTGSLLVDKYGLSPAGRLAVTANRAVAAAVALLAVIFSGMQAGGFGLSAVVLLAVSAGFGISVQQAINARVAVATRQPLAATLVNFIVGCIGLFVVSAVVLATGNATFGGWPSEWWLYLGGPIGVTFIALAAWAVHGVGVLVFGLLSIAGQLLGSVMLDLFAPAHATSFGWPQWLGLTFIAVAVGLATLPQDRFARAALRP